jgi:hypothetical protein
VEDVDRRGFLIHFVDYPVHIWLSAIEKMPDGRIFGGQCGAVGIFLKTEYGFSSLFNQRAACSDDSAPMRP